MKASLRALLTEVIDYAGLFPPASLSLDESIRNFASYVKTPDRWMLARFICPAAKLKELVPYLDSFFGSGPPLRVSALGRASKSDVEFNESVRLDFTDMAAFREQAVGRATIDGYETRIPSTGGMTMPGPSRDVFIEPTIGPNWRQPIEFIAGMPSQGFKLRTGGVEANAFPTVEQVAFAIAKCAEKSGKRIKFTAGLHHPIRHYNESVKTKMHGFVNVFVAGVLAHARKLDELKLVEVLSDEDAQNFTFDDDALRWRDHRATLAEIERARREFVTSFGSCSFDEPRDDLRVLGWM